MKIINKGSDDQPSLFFRDDESDYEYPLEQIQYALEKVEHHTIRYRTSTRIDDIDLWSYLVTKQVITTKMDGGDFPHVNFKSFVDRLNIALAVYNKRQQQTI